jgi:hypothetical protein
MEVEHLANRLSTALKLWSRRAQLTRLEGKADFMTGTQRILYSTDILLRDIDETEILILALFELGDAAFESGTHLRPFQHLLESFDLAQAAFINSAEARMCATKAGTAKTPNDAYEWLDIGDDALGYSDRM